MPNNNANVDTKACNVNYINMDNFGELLTANDINSLNRVHDFLSLDLNQTQNCVSNAALNITSPLLTGAINPSQMDALANGLFDLSNPHLPSLDIANSQHMLAPSAMMMNASPIMPTMPVVDVIGNNIPPPADTFDWQTICNLNNMNTIGQQLPPSIATPATNRKRKQQQSDDDEEDMYTKRRKLNGQTTKIKQETKIKKRKENKKEEAAKEEIIFRQP